MNVNYSSRTKPRRHSYKPRSYGGSHGRRSRSNYRNRPSTIDSRRFINKAVALLPEEAETPRHTFADFGFGEKLSSRLVARGYDIPTPIQDKAIKPIMAGNDVIGLANTGTGKTAAFLLPIIVTCQAASREPNTALIVTPTRELAHQVNDEFQAFTKGMSLFSVVCVGGENISRQKSELRRGVNVVIGTPGRLKDLLRQGELKLDKTPKLVLDEADQMLDMGFLPDMRFIMQSLPANRQVICFSATMTTGVSRLLGDIQNNAVAISTTAAITSQHIDQDVIEASTKEQKIDRLDYLLGKPEFEKILIFGETKFDVQRLADNLSRRGHSVAAIHGNKSQPQRQRALRAFKNSQINVLVATDVAARGLDIPNVHLVVNYDLPKTYDVYVHRIGRTGRAGKTGTARTFIA